MSTFKKLDVYEDHDIFYYWSGDDVVVCPGLEVHIDRAGKWAYMIAGQHHGTNYLSGGKTEIDKTEFNDAFLKAMKIVSQNYEE